MPNALSYLMLLAWPVIAVVLYRRLPLERAVIWSILGAYLILPPLVNFDFPLVPPFNKVSIPNLVAYGCCVLMLGLRVPFLPESTVGKILILLFLFSPVATVLTNSDPIWFKVGGLPGLRAHDSFSAVISQAIDILPFILARQLLATESAQREIVWALMLAGLAYSLPMLVEIRLSPQMNVWVYGFFQHDFIQMMRDGGYRPIVFLPHALWVAFFTLMALMSAVALWRHAEPAKRTMHMFAAGYLGILLVLCKSMASLLYAVVLVPLVRFASVRSQLRIAAVLAVVALFFPLLRGADLVPVKAMLTEAEAFSEDRAASLAFRFNNEDRLLERARERPMFGWGAWGRNRVYDPLTGKDLSVIDGRWIITIGTLGWFGYIAEFGLLAWPILLLARRTRRLGADETPPYVGTLALILAANMVDMLPNATLIPFTFLLAGAALGYAESLARAPAAAPSATPEPEAEIAGLPDRPRTIL